MSPSERSIEGSDATSIVECRNLLRIYESPTGQVQAVKGIDLEIDAGVSTAIVGPSGSGKSSLLRMIAGVDRPSAGDVLIDGQSLGELRAGRRRRVRSRLISLVHQQPSRNLIDHLTVFEQVHRVARARSASLDDTFDMLERIGLADRKEHVPSELSGGEQQRLAFARGAIGSPAILVADEPTAELDEANSVGLLGVIQELAHSGIAVIVASHDPVVISSLDRVVTLRHGAVSSVADRGGRLAVIDRSGRVQLPPEVMDRFAARRAHIAWDEPTGQVTIQPTEDRP